VYVLDTCVVLTLVRQGELGHRIEHRFALTTLSTRLIISIATRAEIEVIADRNHWGSSRRRVLAQFLDECTTVPIAHQDLIDRYVEAEAICHATPGGAVRMGKNDLWIAATSQLVGRPLLTMDRDFAPLAGWIALHVIAVTPD
jgi:tRNA(fMet)-specific endonuclease VapC